MLLFQGNTGDLSKSSCGAMNKALVKFLIIEKL